MENINIKIFKGTDKVWTDETGTTIPVTRITQFEKMKERSVGQISKKALILNEQLIEFKLFVDKLTDSVHEALLEELEVEPKANAKGNFTYYNFDQSIKIEKAIGEGIKFDEGIIQLAKEELEGFLEQSVTTENDAIKSLVLDAFSTSRGKLDPKKILGLRRYRSKIKHPQFLKGLDLIDEAIRRPNKTEYFRIWAKDESGAYQAIRLNFSDKHLI